MMGMDDGERRCFSLHRRAHSRLRGRPAMPLPFPILNPDHSSPDPSLLFDPFPIIHPDNPSSCPPFSVR